jgi:PPM family protein phosphatase
MSTIIVLAAIAAGQLQVAHLGDSRVYLIRGHQIHRLTLDHTWIQNALDHHRISREDAKKHPNRNVIRRYLGINYDLDIDRDVVLPGTYNHNIIKRQFDQKLCLEPGDVILLCSDGLTNKVSDEEILKLIKTHKYQPQKAADKLINMALSKKEQDNITVVLLSLPGTGSRPYWSQKLGWVFTLLVLGLFIYGAVVLINFRKGLEFGWVTVVSTPETLQLPVLTATAIPVKTSPLQSTVSPPHSPGTPQRAVSIPDDPPATPLTMKPSPTKRPLPTATYTPTPSPIATPITEATVLITLEQSQSISVTLISPENGASSNGLQIF